MLVAWKGNPDIRNTAEVQSNGLRVNRMIQNQWPSACLGREGQAVLEFSNPRHSKLEDPNSENRKHILGAERSHLWTFVSSGTRGIPRGRVWAGIHKCVYELQKQVRGQRSRFAQWLCSWCHCSRTQLELTRHGEQTGTVGVTASPAGPGGRSSGAAGSASEEISTKPRESRILPTWGMIDRVDSGEGGESE